MGILDFPHYTRPARFRDWEVPEILLSGNHELIRRWRRKTALEKTRGNRPDLLESGGSERRGSRDAYRNRTLTRTRFERPKEQEFQMTNKVLQKVYESHKREEIPELEPGDTIRVQVKIREGDKERLQAFEGVPDCSQQ